MWWRVLVATTVLGTVSLAQQQYPPQQSSSEFTDIPRNYWTRNDEQNRDQDYNRDRSREQDFNFRDRARERDGDRDVFTAGNFRPTNLPNDNVVIREATYFVLASRMVRPDQVYLVQVNIIKSRFPMMVRAAIQRNGVEIAAAFGEVLEGVPGLLKMKMPPTSVPGNYRLRVEGNYNELTGGQAFVNETQLVFTQRSMTIFIQCDKPVYAQGQIIRFRTIPINTELKAFEGTVEIYMLDPNGRIMRRWLSRQSNLGTVSLQYQLSDQPVFGDWIIRVEALNQIEEKTISVEEYYQTRFEVNVTMPAFFFDNEPFIHGIVMANYTSGAPVQGNLTLKASFRPIDKYHQINSNLENIQDRYLYFDETYSPWYNPPDLGWERVPVLRFFNGSYRFQYPMSELLSYSSSGQHEGIEVTLTATVGNHFLNEVIVGYSTARIYNSTVKIRFFGGSPQIFKPGMPVDLNLVASFHDGSPLRPSQLQFARLDLRAEIEMKSFGGKSFDLHPNVSADSNAIWSLRLDLRKLILEPPQRLQSMMNDISKMRFTAVLTIGDGEFNRQVAQADLLMLSHESPNQKHIKVWSSTEKAKVGEYFVLHVQTNFYVESFNYLVMSKGTILLTGDEQMQQSIKTFAIPLSPEMAPVATIVVYYVGSYGDVVADSLTFPVNGISRNNFTVFINNKKARSGENVEVAIYGEPGAYVALSGIDRSFYAMQAGNELTYSNVIQKMAYFDEETNGTHSHSWLFHSGDPDQIVYFPSSTFGVDVNRTFEYVGLVVFTDAYIHRRPEYCNHTQGFMECLSGRCYRIEQHCDGSFNCDDGTDEASCDLVNATDIAHFRKMRFNRIQRQYENVWLWKDVNIGPHGRFIFNLDVPKTPVHWMITAFGVSPTNGFGMLPQALEYIAILPFYINVEMPDMCKQGEQVGIRVSVFNYMRQHIEATVILSSSPDYKFVHVESHGIVQSYNPRTSHGEHQFFIWIPAQDASIVYIPIVPVRLGDIKVHISAVSLIGSDSATRTLHVEADGLPQYRHQSILLDLSNRAYVLQYMHINITDDPIIPYEEDRYYVIGSNRAKISVVGDVVGPIFPSMPVNSTSLLELPMDCAEQTLSSFAYNMYMTLHMRYIDARNLTQEKSSFHYMNLYYQRAISFLNPDGSFSLFRSDWNQSSPSVWVTAYAIRVFTDASFYEWENYLYIDPKVISQAVNWLLDHQTIEGSFYEITWLPDRKMNSTTTYGDDINGAPNFNTNPIDNNNNNNNNYNYEGNSFYDRQYEHQHYNLYRHRNMSLTAHCLIALANVKDLSDGLGARVSLAIDQATRWLERNLNLLKLKKDSPYEVAIVAYALQQVKASVAEYAFSLLQEMRHDEGGLSYWGRKMVPQPPYKMENQKPFSMPRLPYEYDAENIETTAYALLVHVARQEVEVEPIVKWLNFQRLQDGGWASTQDTIWAMKSLMEYTVKSRLRGITDITVTFEATSMTGLTKTVKVDNNNLAVLQVEEIPHAWGTVKVSATGRGYAILQMHVQYNVDIKKFQTQPPIPAFDLNTHASFGGRNKSHITYLSCQRWTNMDESERSGMAVLDVAIPTGYIIQQQNLDAYVRSRQVRNLQRARFQPTKVLFYFDYLDQEETCINFTIERWYPVANMSRFLPIRIYDYYAPERFNETMFDALTTYVLNICEVCGSSQCPYCPIYNAALMLSPPVYISIFSTILVIATRYFNRFV